MSLRQALTLAILQTEFFCEPFRGCRDLATWRSERSEWEQKWLWIRLRRKRFECSYATTFWPRANRKHHEKLCLFHSPWITNCGQIDRKLAMGP